MIEYVFRPSRRVNGKRVLSRFCSGRYSLRRGEKPVTVALDTPDELVARKRLRDIVVEKQREAEGLIAPRIQRDTAALTLTDLLKEYSETLTRRDLDPRHIKDTTTRLRRMLRETKWRRLSDVRPDKFEKWHGSLRCSAKTRKEYQVSANALLNWLQRTKRIERNPLEDVDIIDTRGKQVRPSRPFTENELRKLLGVSKRRRIVYLTLLYTAQRKNEVKQLVWSDLHLEGSKPYALFRESTMKDDEKRSVPLHPALARALREFRPHDYKLNQRVFWLVFPHYETLRVDLKRAGIEHKDALGRVIHFHSFRKTWQTLGVRYGISQRVAQETLGHSDANLTANVYTDVPSLEMHTELQKLPWIEDAQWDSQKGIETAPFRQMLAQLVSCAKALMTEGKQAAGLGLEMVDATGLEPVTPCV